MGKMELNQPVVKQLFPKSLIASILGEIIDVFGCYTGQVMNEKALIGLFADDPDGFIACACMCQKLLSIWRLSVSDAMCSACNDRGIRLPAVNTKPIIAFSSRHTARSDENWIIPAHQDWASNLGSLRGFTCWLPLVDVPHELGPIEIIPGSESRGFLPHVMYNRIPILCDQPSDDQYTAYPVEVGDAIFFNTLTIHRSGINMTDDRIRISLHFRYDDALDPELAARKYPKNRTDGGPGMEQTR